MYAFSFWGKYGQRPNLQQSTFIHDTEIEEFYRLLSDPSIDVQNFHIISKDIVQMEWLYQSEFIPDNMNTNIFIATFTTCWARLKLYSILEKLNRNVLYYDTDSVIYISRPGEYQPELGDYLGELTNELYHDEYILEFVSAGPKNYAYRTNKGKEVCKVKGFTLNFANSQLINFDVVKQLVFDYKEKQNDPNHRMAIITSGNKIVRNKLKRKLYNRMEKKKYQLVYTKRRIVTNFDTEPYGY